MHVETVTTPNQTGGQLREMPSPEWGIATPRRLDGPEVLPRGCHRELGHPAPVDAAFFL